MIPVVTSAIPLPSPKWDNGCRKYPFDKMEIGDSFAAESDRVRKAAYMDGIRHGRRYTVRKIDGAIRCWRIK